MAGFIEDILPALDPRWLAGWALVAFAVFYLLTNPGGAAGLVHGLLEGLRSAGHSLTSFLNTL